MLAWVDGADKLAVLNIPMIVAVSVANSQCSVVDLVRINKLMHYRNCKHSGLGQRKIS